jgi:hypothetical protein
MSERSINNPPDMPNPLAPVSAPIAAETRPTLQMKAGPGIIAFDDTSGEGPLVIAVPGMGDVRSEYRMS